QSVMSVDLEIIAYNIKHLREQHNLTQNELSEKLMTSRSVIAKWESNVAVPDIVSLARLSRLFNVSIDYIVGNYTFRDDLMKDFKRIYASDVKAFDDEVAELAAYFMSHPKFKQQF